MKTYYAYDHSSQLLGTIEAQDELQANDTATAKFGSRFWFICPF
jgi:hypothetical protein